MGGYGELIIIANALAEVAVMYDDHCYHELTDILKLAFDRANYIDHEMQEDMRKEEKAKEEAEENEEKLKN